MEMWLWALEQHGGYFQCYFLLFIYTLLGNLGIDKILNQYYNFYIYKDKL